MRIILASASPRRRELLKYIFNDFEVQVSSISEELNPKLSFKKQVEQIARLKAEAIFAKTQGDCAIISADTMVVLGNSFLGQPRTPEKAALMLKQLSGKTNNVITAMYVIIRRGEQVRNIGVTDEAFVTMKKLTDSEIEQYVASGEPLDKAGAYAVQGKGALYIKEIKGNFFTIMGLNISILYDLLKKERVV